jgi:type IV secretory pathway VirB4 component
VKTRHLLLGGGACATLAVAGYPREVGLGWLEPLLTYPGRLDVTLHIEPIPPQVAADRLRRQLARLEAGQRSDYEHGRLADFEAQAATDDAHALASRLARGQGRLFRLGLYLTVHAADEHELDEHVSRVRALASALLIDAKPATFRPLQGWITTLPMGLDQLRMRRTFDTTALAAAFPFTSPDLNAALGDHAVLYGINAGSSSLVVWDRFAQDNHNSVILARSGAGKSYLAKLEILRSLYTGVEVAVIDPEDEYARLADAAGGAHIALGAPGVRLNPFDLPAPAGPTRGQAGASQAEAGQAAVGHAGGGQAGVGQVDALTRRALFIHTFIAVLVGEDIDAASRAALDRGIVAAYHTAGITADRRTWGRPAPLLADLAHALESDADPAAAELAARLAPYVTGTWKGLFDGPTTTQPTGHLVVFSLKDLPEEAKTVGTLLALDAVWRRVTDPARRRPRLVIVDEGWLLMRQTEGARFLFRLAKSSRKYWCGLTVITQDAADVLGSDLGRAVVSNAATQILLRQAPQTIDHIADAFTLSQGERQMLLAARRGHGLLACGTDRVAVEIVSSPEEHLLATTDPAELADLDLEPDAYRPGLGAAPDGEEEL